MAWNDEKRAAVISEYTDTMANEYETDEERAAASLEVVKELADKHGEAVNGVRQILSAAKVFIKKSTATKAKAATKTTGTRVNKAEAAAELKSLILAACDGDAEAVDEDIIGKLTGKAALYFAGILQQATGK